MAILKVRNEEGKMVPVPAIIGPPGPKGETGPQGEQGKPFTYDDFTEEQLALLKGSKGDKGDTGPKGDKGNEGPQGARGPMGVQGLRGPEGPEGPKGDKGDPGTPGKNGKSAYDYAKEGGYTGTEEEFAEMLANIHGGSEIPEDFEIVTSDDVLHSAIEIGLVEPVTNDGRILTDRNGVIYTF